ncbi:hypothetical protein [Halorussus litoreus]|uniref:hypothetical protein n=1 Tax=Halorussus litoreus TaxID=1710536 RepID=UPI000E22CC7B|nr:hypothetical protein [Halorussus litoreus]
MFECSNIEFGFPAVGILAVLCSVLGLQLGGATTELLDAHVSVAVALALGALVATASAALGFWFGSTRDGGE